MSLTWKVCTDENGTWADGSEDNFVAFWHITVMSPQKQGVKLVYRHDDDLTAWCNGTAVVSASGWDSNMEQHSDLFSLVEGENHFLFKLVENGGGNRFAAKIVDGENNPVAGLVYSFPQQGSTIGAGAEGMSSDGAVFSPAVVPSAGRLTISRLHPRSAYTVTLIDARGRVARVRRSAARDGVVAVSTKPYARGVYIVNVRSGDRQVGRRVVLP